eukprot:scaffold7576_cov114-Isochrysis_galbana.AAC.7
MPPTAGNTTAAVTPNAAPAPDPMPKAWHSVTDTQHRSVRPIFSRRAASAPNAIAALWVSAAPLKIAIRPSAAAEGSACSAGAQASSEKASARGTEVESPDSSTGGAGRSAAADGRKDSSPASLQTAARTECVARSWSRLAASLTVAMDAPS